MHTVFGTLAHEYTTASCKKIKVSLISSKGHVHWIIGQWTRTLLHLAKKIKVSLISSKVHVHWINGQWIYLCALAHRCKRTSFAYMKQSCIQLFDLRSFIWTYVLHSPPCCAYICDTRTRRRRGRWRLLKCPCLNQSRPSCTYIIHIFKVELHPRRRRLWTCQCLEQMQSCCAYIIRIFEAELHPTFWFEIIHLDLCFA